MSGFDSVSKLVYLRERVGESCMCLDINCDMQELVNDHCNELTTEELIDL